MIEKIKVDKNQNTIFSALGINDKRKNELSAYFDLNVDNGETWAEDIQNLWNSDEFPHITEKIILIFLLGCFRQYTINFNKGGSK